MATVPMKALAESKTRLSEHLCPARRAALSLSMLSWVLSALRESRVSRVVVIGGDARVREVSEREGAEWMVDEFLDLNRAIGHVFNMVWREGRSAIYVPADLPLLTASDVDGMIEASEDGRFLTMCRAHDGGTNGLIAPADAGFEPRFGSDSFRKHKGLAEELGIVVREHRSEGFYRDVDTISDLKHCIERRPPCLEVVADIFEDVNK